MAAMRSAILLLQIASASSFVNMQTGTLHMRHYSAVQMSSQEPTLQQLVKKDRFMRQAGLGAGAVFLLAAVGLGTSVGVIDPGAAVVTLLGTGVLAAGGTAVTYQFNQETRAPCPASFFEVKESPGKGKGLFATCSLKADTYLFDYDGEVLDEDQMFARYPEANGRYIAGLTDNYYIDGELVKRNWQ